MNFYHSHLNPPSDLPDQCIICDGYGEAMEMEFGEMGCTECVAKCIGCGSHLLKEDMERQEGMTVTQTEPDYICNICIDAEQEHDQEECLYNIIHAAINYHKTICIL